MKRLVLTGVITDADGKPPVDRKIAVQSFLDGTWRDSAWPDLDGQGGSTREVGGREPGVERTASAPALRLFDHSRQAVIAGGPMLATDADTLVVDFGRTRLVAEPFRRVGLNDATAQGELVDGVPDEVQGATGVSEEAQAEISRLRGELAAKQETVAGLTRRLDYRSDQLRLQKVKLSQARTDLNHTINDLTTARNELSDKIAEANRLSEVVGTPVKVADVITGLGTQLSQTNEVLAKQPTPFRLSEVHLDLRGRLGQGGDTIVMDGTPDGSGVSATLATEAPAGSVPRQGVPSVLGLTESAAARVLRSVGFRMDAATQNLPTGAGVPGQAISQHPAAGTQAEFGTSVLVIFGVRSEVHA